MVTTLALSLVAGIVSILSPCVLPILPIVLGAAASEHRLGALALAGGLALSFVAVGLFVATIGFSAGLDADRFRLVGALLMVAVGSVLIVPQLQERVVMAAGPASNWASGRLASAGGQGASGQFLIGLLLGIVWSPCVGPTLGAASVLAAKRESLFEVAATMLAFGLGAAFPLLLLGLLSREAILKLRGRMMVAGGALKSALGIFLVAIGLLVASGYDKRVEAALVAASPEWLTRLTTQF
ncbi:MAG: cytochrome c biogenesis CcdA family protein [Thermomicrobiales bacterium]|jgi:cytochrome c biogenesis protein CcdA